MINLPIEFKTRMQALLKGEYEQFLASLDAPAEKGVLVNEHKISVEKFLSIMENIKGDSDLYIPLEKISYERAGFYTDRERHGRHPLHHAGAFYIQEPNAMCTVNVHNFNGDELVLDMCASPGGKSIQLANRIPNGTLISNEFVASRSKILFSNIERMGLKNVIITNDTPTNLAKAYANCFDVVLVDAPCSGEGMFRKDADIVAEWNIGLNEKCRLRQLDILEEADKTLKKGGILIYSTCTYSLEENEMVVRDFLKQHNYELINIDKSFKSRGINIDDLDGSKCVRLYPHVSRGEGQFVAKLKKLDENILFPTQNIKLNNSSLANKFLSDNINTCINAKEIDGKVYHINNENMLKKGVNFVTKGVLLGEIVKNRFEPAHNLFTAFGTDFKMKLELDFGSNDTYKYLKGEELACTLNDGFGAVLINGCSLGGFKISGGKFKNHYPKGLRNLK